MSRTDEEFAARCRHYDMTVGEALRYAPLACYLYLCLQTGDPPPYPHPPSPYDADLSHKSGWISHEMPIWFDPDFIRAAMERGAPWLLMAEGAQE